MREEEEEERVDQKFATVEFSKRERKRLVYILGGSWPFGGNRPRDNTNKQTDTQLTFVLVFSNQSNLP